ncbi:hypothetical protein PAXRUDRAFT_163135 [Paxillus rubicundulus Ve08.2h10]|uniref:Uncharacterized protein n=1 Tax=Paxillus rubicundulus Ve08.2h10 TaxID=930991 RepID=A0A0D0DDF1_9AGAM|nr:hypothetical protein PAXRUDRAFT_163135 [Paxillus rubicundulus Ve08.2h10]
MSVPQRSSDATSLDSSLEVLLEALKTGENGNEKEGLPGKRQWKKELDLGIDYLINAANRAGLKCRRKVFDICFYNSTAESDHLLCNSNTAEGCARCCIPTPTVCCDLHNPQDFSSFSFMQSKPPAQLQCSRLPKYTCERSDYNLHKALQDWCEDKTAAIFGWAALNDLGPSLLMTNALLDRIIDCAHHHKIHTTQDLRKETSWTDSEKYGEEVVAIIRQHAAPLPSPFNTIPLRSGMGLLTAANTPMPSCTYTIHHVSKHV